MTFAGSCGSHCAAVEPRNPVAAQPCCVQVEIGLQCGFIAQQVLRAQRDAAGRGRRVDHVEHACVEEAGQRQYFRDVVSQPRAVLGFDVRIEVDVHLVDHIADGLCVHIATRPIAIDARIAKLSRIV